MMLRLRNMMYLDVMLILITVLLMVMRLLRAVDCPLDLVDRYGLSLRRCFNNSDLLLLLTPLRRDILRVELILFINFLDICWLFLLLILVRRLDLIEIDGLPLSGACTAWSPRSDDNFHVFIINLLRKCNHILRLIRQRLSLNIMNLLRGNRWICDILRRLRYLLCFSNYWKDL